MTENQQALLREAQAYVSDLIQNKVSKSVRFHTLNHTREVVAACEEIAENDQYQLPDEDKLALLLAAWFHDTGYSSGRSRDHETVSLQHARDFLSARSVGQELTDKVMGCINATRMPQNPTTTIERIICDADLFHLGTEAFKEKNRLLRDELREFGGEDFSKKEWRKLNIEFLEAHKYFTNYAREKLQPVKLVHMEQLKEKFQEDIKPDKKEKDRQKEKEKLEQAAESAAAAKKKKEKENQTERGVSTVFRIMAQNQTNLSQMADSKANILISVNSIILTIVISTLFTKLQNNRNLVLPVILLVIICVSAIVFSILATRPNISSGTFTKEDIANKKTNLLFFGNFYKMTLPDYDWAMMELLNDKQYLYSSVVKDNYFLGVVLAKKYRFLRIAYNIFMYGLIIAMIAFALGFIIPEPVEVYAPG
jgi:predicted metal-dependent HD superfamily phosphohydrolase